jgi:pyruvate ferredoxin oxidoreductase alpha subunit
MAARDSGFLQIHCSTCQEVLDSVLIAYRLAENKNVRLPVIVNLDGFYLSYTREPVEVPDAKDVKNFLPVFSAENSVFRASTPSSQAVAVLGGSPYSYFRYEMHLAAMQAVNIYDDIVKEFSQQFERDYPALDAYRTEDAEILFLMIGSFSTKAREVVDQLRQTGMAIGLVRPRLLRPFPSKALQQITEGKKGVAVIDQNISMGKGGVLHTEVASSLYGAPDAPKILTSFIGGLGGRDISTEEFYEIAKVTEQAVKDGATPEPRLLYTQNEYREMQKLQAIAHVEREELESIQ